MVYDQVVLTFHGFFKQGVPESGQEHYRIRYVKLLYFMEDDSMTVLEPAIVVRKKTINCYLSVLTLLLYYLQNCGFPQGRLVRRGKIPKNNMELYSWKDLNIGIDIEVNGVMYHLTDCDEFTKVSKYYIFNGNIRQIASQFNAQEFMAAQGIELNETECQPVDPYSASKLILNLSRERKTPSDDDKLRRYLEFSGKVLT